MQNIAKREANQKACVECAPPPDTYFVKFKKALGLQKDPPESDFETCAKSRKLTVSRLKQQLKFFTEYGIPGFSLFAQISKQFNPQRFAQASIPFAGMVFICYENVIIDLQKHDSLCRSRRKLPGDYSFLYNSASRDRWRYFLNLLKEKRFFLVLITNGLPAVHESEIFDTIVNRELMGIFHAKLFTGGLIEKQSLIHHVKEYIKEQGISFILSPEVYFLASETRLQNTRAFNILPFEFTNAAQTPEAACFFNAVSYFEHQVVLQVPSSPVSPPSPVFRSSPVSASSTIFGTPLVPVPTSPIVPDKVSSAVPSDVGSPKRLVDVDELIQQDILAEDSEAVSADFLSKMSEIGAEEAHQFKLIAAAAQKERIAIQRRSAALRALQQQHIREQQEYFARVLHLKTLLLRDAEKAVLAYNDGMKGFESLP